MTTFYKVSGAGNDFVALIEPAALPQAAWIVALCRRGVSLGADGVLVLTRQQGGARLVHFNADGERNDFCLNGSRAAAQLAFVHGFCPPDQVLALETDVGVLACRRLDATNAEVELPAGLVGEATPLALPLGPDRYPGFRVKVGVPHWVGAPWQGSLADLPLATLGPLLRHHRELGAGGANVNFARRVRDDFFEIRTFERGVEGETLACGSGICATTQAFLQEGLLARGRPIRVLVAGGFVLVVRVDGATWRLAGDARVVASGQLEEGALAVPQPAHWSS